MFTDFTMKWSFFNITPNSLWLCVCYFGLQTLAFKDEFIAKIIAQNPISGWCGKLNENEIS